MNDLVRRVAEVIDPHAFDLNSRAHPEWADLRKENALRKAHEIIAIVTTRPYSHREAKDSLLEL